MVSGSPSAPGDAPDSWLDELAAGTAGRWDEARRRGSPAAADQKMRGWLFDVLPGQAGASPDEHAYAMFELAIELDRRGRAADAFLVLRWIGEHYVNHPDPGVAVRALMTLTDDCMSLGQRDEAHHGGATGALRAAIAAAAATGDARRERALCRAMIHLGYLVSFWSPDQGDSELEALWAQVIRHWQASADPQLRGRVSQALASRAFLRLQRGREAEARRDLAEITRLFGQDPAGRDPTWTSTCTWPGTRPRSSAGP